MYVGVDVGKAQLDIHWDNRHIQIKNNKRSLQKFIKELKESSHPILIVCEPTGGYEKLMLSLLHQHQIAFHLAHANKIRAFSKAKGTIAKTDKMDATLIASYAEAMLVKPDMIRLTKEAEKVGELLKRRNQLIKQKLEENNRLDKILGKETRNSIKAHIKWLSKEIDGIKGALKALERNIEDVGQQVKLLTSVPGIGQLTAWSLVAFLPELGHEDHKKIAALVGVAPYNHDSGKHTGKRFIVGGRSTVRKSLYMAAITAIRCNPLLKDFYQKLIRRGKVAKVAIIAVVRKMISVLNSVIKRGTPWENEYGF